MTLRCYIDDSESKAASDPAVCVAGYIAQGKKWERFSRTWNQALDRSGPNPVDVFHATDFAGNRGKFYKWNDKQRRSFVDALVATTKGHNLIEVGSTFTRSTYKQVMTGDRGHRHGSLHLVAGKIAMVRATAWAVTKGWKYAPSFFVESGSEFFAELREAHKELRKTPGYEKFFSRSGFSEVPKSREYPQTQPADLLAFYAAKWTSVLSGYDPASDDDLEPYLQKLKPEARYVLARLLPGNHNVEYQTPLSLNNVLAIMERGVLTGIEIKK